MSSAGETSVGYLKQLLFVCVFTSRSRSSTPAIILLLERRRNAWPIWNAAEPGTSFIWAWRNVCWVNFQHQSWVLGGWGGGLSPVCWCVSACCCWLWLMRGTNSLREWPAVGCAFTQQSITFLFFIFPPQAYILFMNSREQVSHLRFCVCGC